MRLFPMLYAVFCLVVVGSFVYAKYQGISLFGASGSAATQTGSGGHGGGFLLGAHK